MISADSVRDRSIKLFTYLKELSELRTTAIRTLDNYEEVFWLADIPHENGCHCIAWPELTTDDIDPDIWIEIKKPQFKNPPKPPKELEPWMSESEISDSLLEMPKLKEQISIQAQNNPANMQETFVLSDKPKIKSLWEQYIEEQWWPWAEKDRKLKEIQKIYNTLYSIYQKQQKLGEAYEVIVGIGYLTWKVSGKYEVKRHIIAAQTSLIFEAQSGLIKVGPGGEGAKPILEQDMLDPQERPVPELQNKFEQEATEISDNIWERASIFHLLRSYVNSLRPEAQFNDSVLPPPAGTYNPRITWSPALILRKRSERSIQRIFEEITRQLKQGGSIPIGVRRLVEIIDDAASPGDDVDATAQKGSNIPGTIYFPLPTNEEQRRIAELLPNRHGILVQGPPGTGKSHTIANLICHLLATGQRVLVTSHTARALKVLREKLPKEPAKLCVFLLGNDLEALQSLEDSVREITDKYNDFDRNKNVRIIKTLEERFHEALKNNAALLSKLRAIREKESYRYPTCFGDYHGTAVEIAIRLNQEESKYSWMSAKPAAAELPPLTDEETRELLNLLRKINKNLEDELLRKSVDLENVLAPVQFNALVLAEQSAINDLEDLSQFRQNSGYGGLKKAPIRLRIQLTEGIEDFINHCEKLRNQSPEWIKKASDSMLAGDSRAWSELFQITLAYTQHLERLLDQIPTVEITASVSTQLGTIKANASALFDHLKKGGTLGFWVFRPKVVKESLKILQGFRVNGIICTNPTSLQSLLIWVETQEKLTELESAWSAHTPTPSGLTRVQLRQYQDLLSHLENILKLREKIQRVKESIDAMSDLPEPKWDNTEGLKDLIKAIKAISIEEQLREIEAQFNRSFEALKSYPRDSHPAVRDLYEAVKIRNIEKYAAIYQQLSDLRTLHMELKRRNDLLSRLQNRAPKLADDFSTNFNNPIWDERVAQFTKAWNWAKASRWLSEIADPKEYERLANQHDFQQTSARELLKDLAAEKAWQHCFSRMTERERQYLIAWTKAIKRIGKGTGKHAARHRKDARDNMEQCRSAIPAWVMPLYRVAEVVRPGTDSFDVAIIDEASQSGPEALFLNYIASKIIVVGDDQQISPENVGIDREEVEILRRRHLKDIPHDDLFGLDETSFFHQAQVRYAGRIRLREHFRCMPEIIQFSNELCYENEPLIPLRQYGSSRLMPILNTVHVSTGYQEGSSHKIINRPEADQLCKQIKSLCADPRYEGKTFGVISLLGDNQAKLIEQSLLSSIGPEEMEKRALVCGDAYAFQGDERDIIFLSLVSAPTEGYRIGTLSSERDKRRFNVAVSRAKDQIWLFHSATLNDLSPKCLRYRLLQYVLDPNIPGAKTTSLQLHEIRNHPNIDLRDKASPPAPFGSWFEVDVCLKIAERGFRVIPQYEIASKRIDLLIEGVNGRLAVECDGEPFHGAEKYEEDMARQRQLERCGLTFWRVRGSSFYRNQNEALSGLWQTLKRLGIDPD